jgi:hypothetical protein
MTEVAWRNGDSPEGSPASVRFAGKSLEQLLDGVATGVAAEVRHELDVAVVVCDRHGSRTCGTHSRAGLAVVPPPASWREPAVDVALGEGRPWRGPHALAVPVEVAKRVIGAVLVSAPGPRKIDDADLHDVQRAVTEWAPTVENAVAFADAQARARHLEIALRGRAVIEQAKGILMAREGCDADRAFELLRELSQHGDQKIAVVAAEIVATARVS